jgi:hypothetical protein
VVYAETEIPSSTVLGHRTPEAQGLQPLGFNHRC